MNEFTSGILALLFAAFAIGDACLITISQRVGEATGAGLKRAIRFPPEIVGGCHGATEVY